MSEAKLVTERVPDLSWRSDIEVRAAADRIPFSTWEKVGRVAVRMRGRAGRWNSPSRSRVIRPSGPSSVGFAATFSRVEKEHLSDTLRNP